VLAHEAACEERTMKELVLPVLKMVSATYVVPVPTPMGTAGKAEGQYGGRNEADRAAADANGGVARQRGGEGGGRGSRVRTVGPDDLIRDVCGAVQDTECVIIAE
jgi:hypothetical protein